MAILILSADIGCPLEETARLTAARLHNFRLVTDFELSTALAETFGNETAIPPAASSAAVQFILCRMARENHLLLAFDTAGHLEFPADLRLHLTAPDAQKVGYLMLENNLDRPAAKRRLASLQRKHEPPEITPDLTLHNWTPEQAAHLIAAALDTRDLAAPPLAQLEFDLALSLAAHGTSPKAQTLLKERTFSHPSEQLFANLLDFYRIPWAYEPRSFPLQWNESGAVTEAFAPDFYLPESDLYVELTTMKQSLVTKKNRKVKLLKAIYPHINIQIFYQQDFQDLIFKHGLRATDH